jgi:hypothetical protein
MLPIDFWFDPACPWTWITSRWVVEVAGPRELDVTWRTFSLRHRNKDNPGYDGIRDQLDAQLPGLRVIEAARAAHGDDAVGPLYTALGTLIHHDGDTNLERLVEGIAMAGLPASLIHAGSDASWDAAIEKGTRAGLDLMGDDVGIPYIVVPGHPATFFGPVLSPAPTGDDAVALWDAFVTLGRFEGLYEIKRSRNTRPIFGARPAV